MTPFIDNNTKIMDMAFQSYLFGMVALDICTIRDRFLPKLVEVISIYNISESSLSYFLTIVTEIVYTFASKAILHKDAVEIVNTILQNILDLLNDLNVQSHSLFESCINLATLLIGRGGELKGISIFFTDYLANFINVVKKIEEYRLYNTNS